MRLNEITPEKYKQEILRDIDIYNQYAISYNETDAKIELFIKLNSVHQAVSPLIENSLKRIDWAEKALINTSEQLIKRFVESPDEEFGEYIPSDNSYVDQDNYSFAIEEFSNRVSSLSKKIRIDDRLFENDLLYLNHFINDVFIQSSEALALSTTFLSVIFANGLLHNNLSKQRKNLSCILDDILNKNYPKRLKVIKNKRIKSMESSIISEFEQIDEKIMTFSLSCNSKYKQAAQRLLTPLENNLSSYKHVKKTSVILQLIKSKGYLNHDINIPTEKTLCHWIDSYLTIYHPDFISDMRKD